MKIPQMDDKKSSSSQMQKNTLAELLPGPSPPPPASTAPASNMVAQNPFDDVLPSMSSMSSMSSSTTPTSNNNNMPKGPQQQMHPQHPQNQGPMPGSMPPGSMPGGMPPGSMPGGMPPGGMPMGSMPPGGMPQGPGPSPHGKIYPPNQPMVFNPSNPSAPPIYPCGVCHKEVHENDQAVLCESGCNFWFHRMCTGLTPDAFTMLKAEVYAEWVCDRCLSTKEIPLVKLKP